MCGIVGFLNCGSRDQLIKAISVVKHRGPDYQGVKWFNKKNCGLAHARLSIIDLSSDANQPMYEPNSRNWIVFNGEVFNFQDIKEELFKIGWKFNTNSDTEVVLKAYTEWGPSSISKFNGMFSFAVYNEIAGDLFLCRDRLGIKPLYYYQKNEKLVFASEIKAILECKDYVKEPDMKSLFTPVHFQSSPYTGFKNIFKLEAGHFLIFSKGNLRIKKYWDLHPTEENVSFNRAFEELDFLLNDSIRLQMISDVPVGALLSGGLDSSIISVLMQKKMRQPLNTFTIKFKKEDLKRQGNVDDSYYAGKLAEQFGFNHHEIVIEPKISELLPKIIWHLDEPIADPASINTYLISKEAKANNIKVLLSGMGADEVFSGYRSYLACLKSNQYQKIPGLFRSWFENIVKKIPESNAKRNFKYIRWLKAFLKVASLSELDRMLQIKNSALSPENFNYYFNHDFNYRESLYVLRETNNFEQYPQLHYLTKLCYCDTKTYLTDHNLAYSDKAMMAASVEGRPPLIDHRIVELMFKLPPKYRINKRTQKYILKKISENYLPKEIIYRPKAPFSAPMRGWLKTELKEMVNDILSFDSLKKRGIYNPDFVQKLIINNEKGKEDNSQLIWRLMVNEIWFRIFFN